MDKDGNGIVLPFKYTFAKEWVGDYLPVLCGDFWGVLDSSLSEVLPCRYNDVVICNGMVLAKTDSSNTIVDLSNHETFDLNFDEVISLKNGLLVIKRNNDKAINTLLKISFLYKKNQQILFCK